MVKLRKEELNSLVGKTIYHYCLENPLDFCFAKDTKINLSQLEIFITCALQSASVIVALVS